MTRRVLLVDDDPNILDLLRMCLPEPDFDVSTAESVAGALERAASRCPDMAVLDIVLPDGSGIDLCTILRRRGCTGPIMILSAFVTDEERRKASDAGASVVFRKPFSLVEFLDALHQLTAA